MPAPKNSPLPLALLVLLLLGAGVAALAMLFAGDGDPRSAASRELAQGQALLDGEEDPIDGARLEAPGAPGPTDEERSTVLWPLEVHLELLAAEHLPMLDGGQPTSLGRGAALEGSVVDRLGGGVQAEVRFVAGPNEGRTLFTNAQGSFGASDLYPGLALVEIAGAAVAGSRREVRLRKGAVSELNVSYFRPATVYGVVRGADGAPIEGALVRFDGQPGRTDPEGGFMISGIAAGKVVVEVEAPGHAPFREEQHLSIGTVYTPDKFTYVLREGATLELNLPDAVGGPGEAYVLLYPTRTNVARTFPWYMVNPVRVVPGGVHRIEGLPSGMVSVRVFHEGAVAKAQEKAVNLRSGEVHQLSVGLRPARALTGTVRDARSGQPVANAVVRLEAPDRVATTLGFFRESAWFLESEVLAAVPPALQEVRTDPLGRFVLTAWSEITPLRWLEATSPDGERWAGRLVEAGDEEVVLELEPRPAGTGVLRIDTNQRQQGLDVDVTVDGNPRPRREGHPSWEPIRIGGLQPGTWRARLVWYTDQVLPPMIFEVPADGEAVLRGELPQAALQGQDPATWRRAGREYPSR